MFSFRFSSRHESGQSKTFGSDNVPNKGKKARYADLEDLNHGPGLQGYQTAPVKLMRTFIRAGKTGDVSDEDGIHLQYDVEQETSRGHSGTVRA